MTIQDRKLLRSIYGIHGVINVLAGFNVEGSVIEDVNYFN